MAKAKKSQPKQESSASQSRQFEVSLPGVPSRIVAANNRDHAVAVYMQQCGIIATAQHPTVCEVTSSVAPVEVPKVPESPVAPVDVPQEPQSEGEQDAGSGNAGDDQSERLPADDLLAGVAS